MTLQVELLESSFAAVAPRGEDLVNQFYQNLFADYPQVRPLFGTVDLPDQKRKLLASLKLVVDNLRRPEALVPALEQLGARHVDYGAREEHYPAVGATLLKSLSQIAGEAWTPDVERAWTDAYAVVTEHMLNGAAATTA